MPPYGVNLVDEDDAGSILLSLLEQVAYARGAHANEHLYEIRAGDREERNISLACNRAGQQSLACSRRAHHQHAFRNAAAQLLKLLRFFQELDNFLQFFFGFFNAGHVLESDALLLIVEQFCPRLAKAEGLVAARLHLPQHEDPEPEDEHKRQQVRQHRPEETAP